jgi:hypothetical protein
MNNVTDRNVGRVSPERLEYRLFLVFLMYMIQFMEVSIEDKQIIKLHGKIVMNLHRHGSLVSKYSFANPKSTAGEWDHGRLKRPSAFSMPEYILNEVSETV